MLGAYALGHLTPPEAARVRDHLRDCVSCTEDLREIQPVADRLGLVDAAGVASPPAPPPGLGDLISARVAEERSHRADEEDLARVRSLAEQRRARRTTRLRWGSAAAAVVLVAGAAGGLVGRATAPSETVPTEPIELVAGPGTPVTVESADLVDHTWGVELRFVGEGFTEGETYRAAFRTSDGELVPAGEFRGVGADEMTCFLQSSVLRADVTEVVVTDADGTTVLVSSLA